MTTLIRLALAILLWLDLAGGQPQVWRQCSAQVLHINIATHGNNGGVIREAFERVVLESEDAPCHAIRSLAYDGDARPERLAASSPLDHIAVPIAKDHHMVEAVAAYVVRTLAVVLPARGAADMNGRADHQIARIVAPCAEPLVWRDRRIKLLAHVLGQVGGMLRRLG